VKIRAFEPQDEAAVVALWEACKLTRPWNDPHRDIARKLEVQRELFVVGVLEREIVASVMAGYEGHRGWVNYLAVAPAFRGRGYGRALMRHVEAALERRGCPKLSVLVRNSNRDATEFYRRLGYVQDESVSFGKRLIAD
jgi:ribosomal protein S18 acetylase RimI-like enzyme